MANQESGSYLLILLVDALARRISCRRRHASTVIAALFAIATCCWSQRRHPAAATFALAMASSSSPVNDARADSFKSEKPRVVLVWMMSD
ncbi:hypothetical protein GUJ93_ZPchr0002g26345 [Zizania palustris]|uniref:Uncharacterized protein n=1 Tax=Zizania palustris TaxID=103762 RepID=A0A8J5V9M9_ZIZPA|nr:hypothetical protein GUJ93_ZPchr0002g26345 [Zizania palustris]